jgi:hypothetical protein
VIRHRVFETVTMGCALALAEVAKHKNVTDSSGRSL